MMVCDGMVWHFEFFQLMMMMMMMMMCVMVRFSILRFESDGAVE